MNKRLVAMAMLGVLAIVGRPGYSQTDVGKDDVNPFGNPFAGKVVVLYIRCPDLSSQTGLGAKINSLLGKNSREGCYGFFLVNARIIKFRGRTFLAGNGPDLGEDGESWFKGIPVRVAWETVTWFYLLTPEEAQSFFPAGSFDVPAKEGADSEEDLKGKVVLASIVQGGRTVDLPLVNAKIVDIAGRKFLAGDGAEMSGASAVMQDKPIRVAWDLVEWYYPMTPKEYETKFKRDFGNVPTP
ncbi:MAG: hypothetical protein JXB10_00595 [Pirellulales bacterium]|nr:hypothetical protein [Pirellulales bacterium]